MPLNRIVAFAGPYIAAASGAAATWLLVHVHFLALFHLEHDQLAKAIAQLVVFATVTGVTWLGHQTWLNGWQAHEARVFDAISVATHGNFDITGLVSDKPDAKPETKPRTKLAGKAKK